MALTTGQRVGLYEVIGPLGAGGMGEVYRARDTPDTTSVRSSWSWWMAIRSPNALRPADTARGSVASYWILSASSATESA